VGHPLVNEAVGQLAVGGLGARRGAGDLRLLLPALGRVGEEIPGVARAHEAGAGQGERDARGVDGDPAAAPLLRDRGGGARAAGGVEDQVARVGGHEEAALDRLYPALHNVDFLIELEPLRLGQLVLRKRAARLADVRGPVIRLRYDVEFRRGGRLADPPQFHLQPEELELLARVLVEPVQRAPVLVAEPFGHPDDGDRIQSSRAGHQLAEVDVVGLLQLVFDQHPVVVRGVLAQHVGAEGPHVPFLRLHFQLEPDGLPEQGDVFLARQPRGEIARLVRPYFPQGNPLQPAQVIWGCRHRFGLVG